MRIGATGLAAVFLLVMMAGALTHSASDEKPVQQQADVQTAPGGLPELVGNNLAAEELPKEPLAELGVAPSATVNAEAGGGQTKEP